MCDKVQLLFFHKSVLVRPGVDRLLLLLHLAGHPADGEEEVGQPVEVPGGLLDALPGLHQLRHLPLRPPAGGPSHVDLSGHHSATRQYEVDKR